MQIRKITHDVLKDFPELEQQGFNEHDMFLVWRSYFEDVKENMIYPNELYVKFLNLGTFFIPHSKVVKRKKDFKNSLKKNFIVDEKKVEHLIKICYRKIEFYETLIKYLDGYSEKADKDIKGFNTLIKSTQRTIEELKLIKDECNKKTIARNLEKQISDSRGNQEQDIQEGAH